MQFRLPRLVDMRFAAEQYWFGRRVSFYEPQAIDKPDD